MTDKSIDVYQRSLAIFDRLTREQPLEDWNRFNAAISYDQLAENGREIEPDPSKLFDYYRRSLALRQELMQRVNTKELPPFRRELALQVSHLKLAALSLEVGDPAGALEEAQQARDGFAKLNASEAGQATLVMMLASAHTLVGKAQGRLGQHEQARESYAQAIKLLEPLVQADALDARARQELGRTHDDLGELDLEEGDLAAARAEFSQARATFQALVDQDSETPEFKWFLAGSLYHLAAVEQAEGGEQAAQELLQQGLALRQRLLENDQNNIQRRIELMLCLARLGRHEEAGAIADEVRAYAPQHPGKLIQAAAGHALCLPSLKEEGKTQEWQSVLDRAVATVEQALASGYKDLESLSVSEDLKALRGEAAFQALLDRLGVKPPAAAISQSP
jgi:tetratricopeptide (TPR) repeat protein